MIPLSRGGTIHSGLRGQRKYIPYLRYLTPTHLHHGLNEGSLFIARDSRSHEKLHHGSDTLRGRIFSNPQEVNTARELRLLSQVFSIERFDVEEQLPEGGRGKE